MLKYIETVKRLSTDKDGVVSLEYVVVAACVVAVVITAFSAGGSLPGALVTAVNFIYSSLFGGPIDGTAWDVKVKKDGFFHWVSRRETLVFHADTLSRFFDHVYVPRNCRP